MSEKKPPAIMLFSERLVMLKLLPDEQLGRVIRAAIDLYFDGAISELNQNESLCFELIKDDMQRNNLKYEKICERNKNNRNSGKNKNSITNNDVV